MDTAMSVKRSFVSDRNFSKPVQTSGTQYALYAMAAGLLLLIVGAQTSVDILMIVGFFFAVSAGLALNALFWSGYYKKHGEPEIDLRQPRNYE